jgi:Flp pilus assembly protein TadG
MKRLTFPRSDLPTQRHGEHGVTMVLVAIAMVAIIAMAALSIDVITLYLAREEAQRAADAGALAAARVISVSGVTGTAGADSGVAPWTAICGPDNGTTTGLATRVATAVAQENSVGSIAPTVNVTYSSGSGTTFADCTAIPGDDLFGVNPLVTVQVSSAGLPTLFSRIWSRAANTVSATATAEAFNPSNSGKFAGGGDVVPVTPRCVKPWIIPNTDPATGSNFVARSSGAIPNASQTIVTNGVLNNSGPGIGERQTLWNNCSGPDCSTMPNPPTAFRYVPAYIAATANAAPSCSNGANGDYQKAITGCDVNTVYACGNAATAQADLTTNRGADISAALQCATNMPAGNDSLDVSAYPFLIKSGSANPTIPSAGTQVITSSNSIMSLPIYDNTAGTPPGVLTGSYPTVPIVGFLQVFINSVDASGNMDVYILNVAGCSTDASTTRSAPGTSPVPIRLITPH